MAYPKTLREFSREIAPRIGPTRINPGNIIGKLRRIRIEVGQIMQQLDDALANIDEPADDSARCSFGGKRRE